MTDITEFSRFDRVLSSTIILSPALEFLYANPMAKRQHPLLSAKNGISTRLNPDLRRRMMQTLQNGRPVRIPWAESDGIFLLFEPVFNPIGGLMYVYLQVETPVADFDSLLPILTDGELLSLLEREVATPLNQFYLNLNLLERHPAVRNDSSFLKQLIPLKTRLLQVCEFLERAKYAYPSEAGSCSFCDADKLLSSCAEQFRFFKYQSCGPTHVPLEEAAFSLLLCDVLSNLYLRQGPKPMVEGTLTKDETGTTLVFSAGKLRVPLDVPCNGDYDGIDLGVFSVKARVQHAGGTLTVSKNNRGTLLITVKLPQVRFRGLEVSVSEPDAYPGAVQRLAFTYLSLITSFVREASESE